MRTTLTLTLGLLMVVGLLAGAASATLGGGTVADTDGDGLDDLAEFVYGTDPLNADTDDGGAPDGWETYYDDDANRAIDEFGATYIDDAYHFNANLFDDEGKAKFNPGQVLLTRSNGANVMIDDPDGDGAVNGQEYILGTDPTNPDTDGDGLWDADDPDPLTDNGVHTGGECTSPHGCNTNGGGGSGEGQGEGEGAGSGGGGGEEPTEPGQGNGNGEGDEPGEKPGVGPSDPHPGPCGNQKMPTDPASLPETRLVLVSALPNTVVKGQFLTLQVYVEVDDGTGWAPLDSFMDIEVELVYPDLSDETHLVGLGTAQDAATIAGGETVLMANLVWTAPGAAPAGEAGLKVSALGNDFAAPSEAVFGL